MTEQRSRGLAVVTGASSGIGKEFAEVLARRGYDLLIIARDAARLEDLAARIRERGATAVEVLIADLTDEAALRAVEARIAAEARLTLLVNNAGFGTSGPFAQSDISEEEREIRLNVLAVVRLARAALPGMVERREGALINVSSLASFMPGPYNATYYATKAYVTSFSEALHEEVRGSGVVVQALCPGFTHTEFHQRAAIKKSAIPGPVWMSSESVVRASLRALDKGYAVYVPGWHFRLLAAISRVAPRAVARRLSGLAGSRAYRS